MCVCVCVVVSVGRSVCPCVREKKRASVCVCVCARASLRVRHVRARASKQNRHRRSSEHQIHTQSRITGGLHEMAGKLGPCLDMFGRSSDAECIIVPRAVPHVRKSEVVR